MGRLLTAAILSDSYYIKTEHLGMPGGRPGRSLDELQDAEIRRVLD